MHPQLQRPVFFFKWGVFWPSEVFWSLLNDNTTVILFEHWIIELFFRNQVRAQLSKIIPKINSIIQREDVGCLFHVWSCLEIWEDDDSFAELGGPQRGLRDWERGATFFLWPKAAIRCISMLGFPSMEVRNNGWFERENRIKMDDLGVPPFIETPMWKYAK